ncbi:MAG: glutathione binding-like protein [Pseudomonadota bacterium]|nr:glutathione binding-like protein [Pseudomonadota bacterium]
MIDVYTWPTPNGHKVHILLQEAEIEHNIIPINIQEGDQFRPDFLKISPNNKMPAIVDPDGPNGKPISVFESAACLIYLANKSGKFLPQDKHSYYDVMQWLFFQMGSVGPMLGQCHHFNAYAPLREPMERLQYGVDRYVSEGNRIYGVINTRLEGREWIAADEYTIADMAIMPWLRDPAKQGIDIAKYPNLMRWRDKIWKRPQVMTALETLAENRRKDNSFTEKSWELMYGKTQVNQGQQAD